MLDLFVGYDPREAAAYHVFCESVIENASGPVRFTPLHSGMLDGFDGQQDGSNAFIYSRFLVPYLKSYTGFGIFVDGDMSCDADIYELYGLRDATKAVQVVKHEYETCSDRKYIGTPMESDNEDYPRKNWSSVVLWNCSHPSHGILTPELVGTAGGAFLHRFAWLNDEEIGELPPEWNWLDLEYPASDEAKIVHHTLGSPGFEHYQHSPTSRQWNLYLLRALNMEGERQAEMVRRAHWHYKVMDKAG